MRGATFLVTILMTGPAAADCSLERGIDWQNAGLSETAVWNDIVYGNGLFVAVGSGGALMTSADGIAWTPRDSVLDVDLTGVAFGGGRFVAVASDRITKTPIITSTDGITWTTWAGEQHRQFNDVVYGDGRFVAISGSKGALVSSDGLSWAESREQNTGNNVIFADGRFVSVDGGIHESVDGSIWQTTPLPKKHNYWTAIAYGDGRFLAASPITGVTLLMDSANGREWSPLGISLNWTALTYGDGLFAGTADGSDERLAVSADGKEWVPAALGEDGTFTAITFGNDRFVALGEGIAAVGVCAD